MGDLTAAELDAMLRLKCLHDEMRAEVNGPPDPDELLRRFDRVETDRAVTGFYARFRTRPLRPGHLSEQEVRE